MKRYPARTAVVRQPRRGAAMVFVMILLLVISMIGISVVRAAIAQHRQRLSDEIRAQTVRLAEAGWQRAARKLASGSDDIDEVWRLGSDAFGPDRAAEVRIELTQADNDPDQRHLKVTADYPIDNPLRNRFTLEGEIGKKLESRL